MCSDSPDMSGVNKAAEDSAALGKEALDWYTKAYADQAPIRDEAARISLDQARLQTTAAQKQLAEADDTAAYQKRTFRPGEEKLMADAMGYDTPERREAAAGQAMADVGTQADIARGNVARMSSARGVDVSSPAFAANLNRTAVAEAAAKAAAGNAARTQVETLGTARLADATSLGRNIASSQLAQVQSGVGAGNSASGNAAQANSTNTSGNTTMGAGFSNGLTGVSNSGNLMLGAARAGQSDDSGLWGAVGKIGGAFIASDEKQKTDRKPADAEISLAAVRKTPIEKWRYRDDSAAADGGDSHVGPMAQTVNANMGEDAAPGGKKIDLISLNGHTMNAVKALDKKVEKLNKTVIRLADARQPAKRSTV